MTPDQFPSGVRVTGSFSNVRCDHSPPPPTVMPCERLGSHTRFSREHHLMLFETAFPCVGFLGQGMLMGQAKILAADPGLKGRLV
jgi:hypothetical protein